MISETRLNKMIDAIISQIDESRKVLGWSVRELSEKSGVSMHYLYRLLRREQDPTIDTLIKILQPLGLHLTIVQDAPVR